MKIQESWNFIKMSKLINVRRRSDTISENVG